MSVLLLVLQKHIGGFVQDCSNFIANALELLQSCTKPSTCSQMPNTNTDSATDERDLVEYMKQSIVLFKVIADARVVMMFFWNDAIFTNMINFSPRI